MELIVFPPTYGEPAGSPFATKALALLELAKVKYKLTYLPNPTKMPKGKLPVLKVGDRMIPDSNEIREYIEAETGFDFDAGLSAKDRAISTAVIRMIEEHVYFIVYTSRWKEDKNWEVTKAENFGAVPAIMRGFITRMVRKGAVAQCIGQGMGRHSKTERLSRFKQDIDAIETLLGDKDYLFGDSPKAADISTITALRFTAAFRRKNDLSDYLMSKPTIMAYLQRGKEALYPK
jgi:glutathione S-transferase